jgi:hypothetical protein
MQLENKFINFMAGFIVVAFLFMFLKNNGTDTDTVKEVQAGGEQKQVNALSFNPQTTGSLGDGDAVVELKPQMIDQNRLLVKFSINTHSVSLAGYDLKEMATLEYGDNVLKPVKASRVGGHHSSGKIEFNINEDIDRFTIRINGIPDVEERIYQWDVG